MTSDPLLAVHGGASREWREPVQAELDAIAADGYERLAAGEPAVDVVEAVTTDLERTPAFNAGVGSKLQLDGVPRPEAGVMTGDGSVGSIIGLEGIATPTAVARTVMEESNNSVIAAPYATQFALEHGFTRADLGTAARVADWTDLRAEFDERDMAARRERLRELDDDTDGGTVGCVARDAEGRFCAATSTGGRQYQEPGRVGDSPLPGCGFYCDDTVAVSTTGTGEAIMQVQLAARVARNTEDRETAAAAEAALSTLSERTDGIAGVVAVSAAGDAVAEHSSPELYAACHGGERS